MIDVIVIAAIAGPAILLLLLRSNAALTFLSLCLGSVLARVASGDAAQLLGGASLSGQIVSPEVISLVLLLLPAVLTALFMVKSTRPNRLLFQLLPAVGVGAAALVLSEQYLSAEWQSQLALSQVWQAVDALGVLVIGFSAFVCLLIIWTQRPKHADGKDGHH